MRIRLCLACSLLTVGLFVAPHLAYAQFKGSVAAHYGWVNGGRDLTDAYPSGSVFGVEAGLHSLVGIGIGIGLVFGWTRSTFSCTDSRCSDDVVLQTSASYIGPRVWFHQLGPVTPWIQGGVGFLSFKQEGTDTEFRDVAFSSSTYQFYYGAAGIDIDVTRYLAVTGSVRYGISSVYGRDSLTNWRLPGPLGDRMGQGDFLEFVLLGLELGFSLNTGNLMGPKTR